MENSADKTKEQNATESTRWSLWRLVKIIFLTINIHVSILRIVYATLAWAYQFDSLLCSFFSAESDKGVASVQATERIHHQAQVPDGASFLKQRNQLILKKVSGDFAYKYLPGWEREEEYSAWEQLFEFDMHDSISTESIQSALSGKLSV